MYNGIADVLHRSERKPFVDEKQSHAYLRREVVKIIKSTLPKGVKIRTKVRLGDDGHLIIDAIVSPPPTCRFIDITIDTKPKEKTE